MTPMTFITRLRRSAQGTLGAGLVRLNALPAFMRFGVVSLAIGFFIGLVIFGWWLTPVEWTGGSPAHLTETDQEIYLITMARIYAIDNNQQDVLDAFGKWPEAPAAACALARRIRPVQETDAQALESIAALLNGDGGCAHGAATAASAPERSDIPLEGVFVVTTLSLVLLVLLVAIFQLVRAGYTVRVGRAGDQVAAILSSTSARRLPTARSAFAVLTALALLLILLAAFGRPLLRTGGVSEETIPEDAVSVPLPDESQEPPAARPVTAAAVLEPVYYAQLSFEDDGLVAEVLIETGETVKAGDPLMQLDSTDAKLAVLEARQELSRAETELLVSQTQLEIAEAEVATAESQVTIAEAQLLLVNSEPREEELAAAQARLGAANATITAATGSRDSALNVVTHSAIEAAETNLALATSARHELELQYDIIINTCFDQPDGSVVCPYYGPVEEKTRARLEAAHLSEAAAQATLEHLQAGPSPAQQQAANAIVTAASANRDIAQAELNLLLAPATREEIEHAEVAVEQAQVNVKQSAALVLKAKAEVTRAELQVSRAQVTLAAAESALEELALTAPFDGVVARLDAHAGEVVVAGTPLVTLADYSGWIAITTDLSQLDLVRVAAGSQAEVSMDAIPGQTIRGTVSRESLTPRFSEGDVVYEVVILLNDDVKQLPLRWGMTALVSIKSE